MSIWTGSDETKLAKEIKEGDRVSWVGSFGVYTALSDAKPDPTYPGRVKFEGERNRRMAIRLPEDREIEVWPSWMASRGIQYPITVKGVKFEGDAFCDDPLVEAGSLVKVRVANKNPKEQGTHLGIYLGRIALGKAAYWNEEAGVLKFLVGHYNPAMWVPALGRIVKGCESWWGPIKSEDELREITDEDINDIWYVKLLKGLGGGLAKEKSSSVDTQ